MNNKLTNMDKIIFYFLNLGHVFYVVPMFCLSIYLHHNHLSISV